MSEIFCLVIRFEQNSAYIIVFFSGADDVVRRHRYCDHLVTMYVCVWVCRCVRGCMDVYVSTIKRKPLIATRRKLERCVELY